MNASASRFLSFLLCLVTVTAQAEMPASPAPGAPPAATPVTLPDAYARALKISETVAIQEEDIRRAEAQFRQARAAILPDVRLVHTEFLQDASGESQGGLNRRRRTPETSLQAEQPLFRGFREFQAMKAGQSQIRRNKWNLEQGRRLVLQDVADVFFVAVIAQRDLEITRGSIRLTDERIDELTRRVNLGKSRRAEILSARVTRASLLADLEDQRATERRAREALRFFTGIPPEATLAEPSGDPTLPELEKALKEAQTRPDLLAQDEQLRIAYYNVKYEQSGHYPYVRANGSYYLQRVGPNEDVKWDALLTVDFPLFQGGLIQGRIAEARSLELEARLTRARLARQIEREVRTAHVDFASAVERARAYREAVELATENYRIQQDEYRLGLINNLEILSLLSTIQTLKSEAARAWATAWLDDVQLRIATGRGLETP